MRNAPPVRASSVSWRARSAPSFVSRSFRGRRSASSPSASCARLTCVSCTRSSASRRDRVCRAFSSISWRRFSRLACCASSISRPCRSGAGSPSMMPFIQYTKPLKQASAAASCSIMRERSGSESFFMPRKFAAYQPRRRSFKRRRVVSFFCSSGYSSARQHSAAFISPP